jgi:hypothetical protein
LLLPLLGLLLLLQHRLALHTEKNPP